MEFEEVHIRIVNQYVYVCVMVWSSGSEEVRIACMRLWPSL
jgi:hypothetical protein